MIKDVSKLYYLTISFIFFLTANFSEQSWGALTSEDINAYNAYFESYIAYKNGYRKYSAYLDECDRVRFGGPAIHQKLERAIKDLFPLSNHLDSLAKKLKKSDETGMVINEERSKLSLKMESKIQNNSKNAEYLFGPYLREDVNFVHTQNEELLKTVLEQATQIFLNDPNNEAARRMNALITGPLDELLSSLALRQELWNFIHAVVRAERESLTENQHTSSHSATMAPLNPNSCNLAEAMLAQPINEEAIEAPYAIAVEAMRIGEAPYAIPAETMRNGRAPYVAALGGIEAPRSAAASSAAASSAAASSAAASSAAASSAAASSAAASSAAASSTSATKPKYKPGDSGDLRDLDMKRVPYGFKALIRKDNTYLIVYTDSYLQFENAPPADLVDPECRVQWYAAVPMYGEREHYGVTKKHSGGGGH